MSLVRVYTILRLFVFCRTWSTDLVQYSPDLLQLRCRTRPVNLHSKKRHVARVAHVSSPQFRIRRHFWREI